MNKEGHVFWITGLSGSGKTTLGIALSKKIGNSVLLDGDVLRADPSNNFGYDQDSRIKQIEFIREKALNIYSEGKVVIASALYSNPEILSKNRETFKNYTEIYLRCSLHELIERDSKGLYSGNLQGQIKNVVGMDIEWHEPPHPDFVFDNTVFQNLEHMTNKILLKYGKS